MTDLADPWVMMAAVAVSFALLVLHYTHAQRSIGALIDRAIDRLDDEHRAKQRQLAEAARDQQCAVGEIWERRRELFEHNAPLRRRRTPATRKQEEA